MKNKNNPFAAGSLESGAERKVEIATSAAPPRNDVEAWSRAGTKGEPVIGAEEVRKAHGILMEYKNGKKNLEARVIANEQWYKLRHWEYIRDGKEKHQVEPVSAWLFNSLQNKHADAMDNYPMANILPREETDKPEAQKLTAIVPVVMEQNDYEQVYSDTWDDKLRGGTGITGVFWNPQKLGGLGDIEICQMDVLNLFWEPGITDIQKSPHFFSVELWDKDQLKATYPQVIDLGTGDGGVLSQYVKDDDVKTENKCLVVDWYYKKRIGARTVLHYCKYVGQTVLFASENDPQYAQRGWYHDGEYPFEFDPLFKVKQSPCGFGYIDVAKYAQQYIDEGDQDLWKNLKANARPRYLSRNDSGINEEEFSDLSKDIVHYEGSPEDLIPIKGAGLSGVYVTLKQNKIEELKEVTGNRDVSTGGTTSGVTAAAGIAAMQEAGSKLSRDGNKASYRRHRRIVTMVIERIRQFYDHSRCFRILGPNGQEAYTRYDNSKIRLQQTGTIDGKPTYRLPVFDVEISAQKQNPYSRLSQNELAIQFYNSGFFNPQMADQAIACLELMDFDRKQFVIDKIQTNAMLFQQLQQAQQRILQLSQLVDKLTGSNLTGALGTQRSAAPAAPAGQQDPKNLEALGAKTGEAATVRNARQRVAESTSPT